MFSDVPCVLRHKLAIIGDFNVNLLNCNDAQTHLLTNFMRSIFMAPIIKHATWFAPQSNIVHSQLDHIWINFINCEYQCGSVIYDQSDPFPVFLSIKTSTMVSSVRKTKFPDFPEACINNFRGELPSIQWNFSEFQSVNGEIWVPAKQNSTFLWH